MSFELSKREISSRIEKMGEVVVPALENSDAIGEISKSLRISPRDLGFAVALAKAAMSDDQAGKEGSVGLFKIPHQIYRFEGEEVADAAVTGIGPVEILHFLIEKVHWRELRDRGYDKSFYRPVEALTLADLVRLAAAMRFCPDAPVVALAGIGQAGESGHVDHFALFCSSLRGKSISTTSIDPTIRQDIIVPVWLPPESEDDVVGQPPL